MNLEAPDHLCADWQSLRQIYTDREVLREQCISWENAKHNHMVVKGTRQWFADLGAVLQWRLDWRRLRQRLNDVGSRLICLSILETDWGSGLNSYQRWFGDWDAHRKGALNLALSSQEDLDWEVLHRWRATLEDLVQSRPDMEDPQRWRMDLQDFRQRFKAPGDDELVQPRDNSHNAEWTALLRRFMDWDVPRQTHTGDATRLERIQIQALLRRLEVWEDAQKRGVLTEDPRKWHEDLKDLLRWRVDWEFVQQDRDADYWRRVDMEVLQQDWNGYVQWRAGWEILRVADAEPKRADWKVLQQWHANFADLQRRHPRTQDSQQWIMDLEDFQEELVHWDVPYQWRASWADLLQTVV